jgi:hypothetical protein
MNRQLCLVLAMGIAAGPGASAAAQEADERPSKAQLQQMYSDYLREEGFSPKVDEDGDVGFKFEGGNYFIDVDESDPMYFSLVYANFWEIEDGEERAKVLEAANETSRTKKVIKVYAQQDNVWASVEIFLPAPDQFQGVFNRSLTALRDGKNEFISQMRK